MRAQTRIELNGEPGPKPGDGRLPMIASIPLASWVHVEGRVGMVVSHNSTGATVLVFGQQSEGLGVEVFEKATRVTVIPPPGLITADWTFKS